METTTNLSFGVSNPFWDYVFGTEPVRQNKVNKSD
jgi:sterol desaturase/sphingolipid hydroxylase (fatty acid hydroxylase superfamily)